MSFLNIAGLWGLLGIPVLILIYIIKPKFQEKLVTSTFIWKLSRKYKKKSLPVQLTNLLLLFVQLLIICAISLILARPVIITEDGAAEKVVILDASASMLVEGEKGNRFEEAKSQICALADEMESYGRMTVILAAGESRTLIARSDSEQSVKAAVEKAECTYGKADLNHAFLLAEEVLNENPEAAVYLFTDKQYEENESIQVVNVAEEAWNVAVTSMEAVKTANREIGFSVEVTSYGMDTVATAVLYVDGILADAQLVGLLADVPQTVEFAELGIRQYETAHVYIEAEDAVLLDNEYHLVDGKAKTYEVLLVSAEPAFLEAALMTFDNLNLTTAASFDELDQGDRYLPDGTVIEEISSTGYDLYVYDQVMPKELPKDGAVWMFAPENVPKGVTFKLGETVVSESYLEFAPDSGTELFGTFSREVAVEEVYINEYAEISSALGFETIFTCNDAPVILAGESGNVRTVLFAFPLSASNLPLRIAFPAMIYNMIEYSLCSVLEKTAYEAGEEVTIQKVNGAALTLVQENHPEAVAQNHVRMPVSYVAEIPGLYKVTQILADESVEEMQYFVHLAPEESNITASGGTLPEFTVAENKVAYEKEITRWFVLLLLVLIVVEWGLQYREQF